MYLSRLHLRQSASFFRYSSSSSSATSLMASLNPPHKSSWSGNLSRLSGPTPPVTLAGAGIFSLGFSAFCPVLPFCSATFSFSFWGQAVSFLADSALAYSSSMIPASNTVWSKSVSASGILPCFLQMFLYISGVIAAVMTRFSASPECCTLLLSSLNHAR